MTKAIFDKVPQTAISILLVLTLAWLTISLPFVYQAQQAKAVKIASTISSDTGKNRTQEKQTSDENPLAGTTEEKTPTNPLSEYLHTLPALPASSPDYLQYGNPFAVATYIAFHGELTGPPPKFLLS